MRGDCQKGTRAYSFVIVISVLVVRFTYGLRFSVGVYYTTFLEVLQYDHPSQVALGVALFGIISNGIGPVAGALINRFGCRRIGILGGLLGGASLALTTLFSNVHYMCFMFGAFSGAGLGLINLAAFVTLTYHFDTYRPLLFSIASACASIGSFIYPITIQHSINHYGWRGSILVVAGLSLNGIVCAATWRDNSVKKAESLAKSFNLSIFRNRDFTLLCICHLFVSIGLTIVYVYLGAYAVSVNMSEDKAALLYSTRGAAGIAGRLIYGGILQIPGCTALHAYIVGFTILGLSTLLIPLAGSDAGRYILIAVFGLSSGGYDVCTLEMGVMFLGKELTASSIGTQSLFFAIGGLIGGPCGSVIYQTTGEYTNAVYLSGSAITFGTLIMLIPLFSRCKSSGTCGGHIIGTQRQQKDLTAIKLAQLPSLDENP